MLSMYDIIENLPAHIVHGSNDYQDIVVEDIVAGDLMSDILVASEAPYLLVTSLATSQTVRTADIVGAKAILLVNDKLPSQEMKDLAEKTDITLLATPLPMYEACVSLSILNSYR